MITDVAIDLDGVLYPFVQEFEKFCSRALNMDHLAPPTHWHFYEDWGLSADEFHHLLVESIHTGVFLHGEPPIGAQAAINALRKTGVKVHYLTSRPAEAWADTAWWLDHHMLRGDSLHFTEDKKVFASIPADWGLGAMLDDSPLYLEDLAPYPHIHRVVFDQPWNKDVNLPRVETLMGFARTVSAFNEAISKEGYSNA